jgi:hypothetical protein
VKGESLDLKTRMVAAWMDHGGSVPQNKQAPFTRWSQHFGAYGADDSYDLVLWWRSRER